MGGDEGGGGGTVGGWRGVNLCFGVKSSVMEVR